MYMSTHEIISMYKEAADKNAQIEILADLNACSKEDILLLLQNEGLISGVKPATSKKKKPRGRAAQIWTEEIKDTVRRLCAEGLSNLEIAERLGLDAVQVKNGITRHGLREKKGESSKAFVPCDSRGTSKKGQSVPRPAEKVDALSVIQLIRDYAKCIMVLPSGDIRNYEKIMRTFAESIIEGADRILEEGAKYGG